MHAPPKSDLPIMTADKLKQYDAFLFGIPTRYGNQIAQVREFWDSTGQLWQSGALVRFDQSFHAIPKSVCYSTDMLAQWGKYGGLFVSTATQGGGQETTALSMMSTFAHHGIIYVPLGYKTVFGQMADNGATRGGSAWGAGTLAVNKVPHLEHRPWRC